MKKNICFSFGLVVLLTIFASAPSAQSLRIASKKVTYTRPKPSSDFKKTFTVNYPKVSGVRGNLAKKLAYSISYQKVLNFRVADELGEYQWLEEADFSVGYNKKGVLSIYLSMTGTAAHQTTVGKNIVVDLKTGKQVKPAGVFTNLSGLVAKLKEIQNQDIREGIKIIKADPDYSNENTVELFKFADFKILNLDGFSVNDDGVSFVYDYGFPYILRTIEPGGNYFLSWREIKPFIKRPGLLGKFVR